MVFSSTFLVAALFCTPVVSGSSSPNTGALFRVSLSTGTDATSAVSIPVLPVMSLGVVLPVKVRRRRRQGTAHVACLRRVGVRGGNRRSHRRRCSYTVHIASGAANR